jgi:dTMP kinase
MPDAGKLIVLEGIDAALLDVVSQELYRWLRGQSLPVEQTGEPTYGPIGAQIRLVQQGRLHVDPASLALLWVAERLDHLRREDGLLSWLAQGRHVLCVRYLLFSYASQWSQVEWDWLRRINAPCRPPDLTLFVDVPRFRAAAAPSFEPGRLREGYLDAIAHVQAGGTEIVRVDGRGTPQEIALACRRHVAHVLGQPLPG